MPCYRSCLLIFCSTVITPLALGQSRYRPIPPRAPPPPMSPTDWQEVFFEDAFTHLQGTRPRHWDAGALPLKAPPTVALPGTNTSAPSESIDPWSSIVDAAVIEDEVKRIHTQLARSLSTPGRFKGGGYRDARQQFNELALLFGIIARYEGDVRWKPSAQAAAHRLTLAARATRVGTPSSFQVAQGAHAMLEDLIRGGNTLARIPIDSERWGDWVDRGALMSRLERSLDETISPGTADEREFGREHQQLFHEAQLVHAIGRVLANASMPEGDDEDYLAYCRQMIDASGAVARAVEQRQYQAARTAVGKIQQACSNCHEDYRE